MKERWKQRTIGAVLQGTEAGFRVWAPLAGQVQLELNGRVQEMEKEDLGYWRCSLPARPGDRYGFRLDGSCALPDPASLAQPGGVHEASALIDPAAHAWADKGWNNHPLEDYIIYELHTGCFTPEGTFAGIEAKLDHLVALGITAIELMPLAQFPGNRNWGYDGVFPYAVQHSYGGARGLQRLVDSCHRKGLAVILDVVYNHLGPEGNCLGCYGPYFTEKYRTPWGGALNFDDAWCDGVRDYFVQNALMWFRDFHIDALRLDAVHAIRDFSPVHLLREIRDEVDKLMKATGGRHYLMTELDLNDPRFISPAAKGGYGMDAQWIDEFHHALRVAAGGGRNGYYEDFNGVGHLAKAYRDAYVYDGQWSAHRKKRFGLRTDNPGRQFVVFSQNHDQVGNRMLGERTSALFSFEMQKLLAGAVLVSPFLPLLFMGEEWSEPHPFCYFVSHTNAELAEAVRRGRKAEFAAFHADGKAPDPLAEDTFRRSKLQWHLKDEGRHRAMLDYYRALIGLRKADPLLRRPDRQGLEAAADEATKTILLQRRGNGRHLACLLNFSEEPQTFVLPAGRWALLLDSADPRWLGPSAAPPEATATATVPPQSIRIYNRTADG